MKLHLKICPSMLKELLGPSCDPDHLLREPVCTFRALTAIENKKS